MKTHGLMFKDAMVRAILDGTKTQTRRFLGHFYEKGDHIYVKEAWRPIYAEGDPRQRVIEYDYRATYVVGSRLGDKLGGWGKGVKWKSSMFMPRIASRIWLEITDARVEPLNSITRQDAIAEGLTHVADGCTPWGVPSMPTTWHGDPRESYRQLWETINGIGTWATNPEVRALTFRRIDR